MHAARSIIALGTAVAALAVARPAVAQTWVNESGSATEADFVNLQFPSSFTLNPGQQSPSIFGRIYEATVTEAVGANAAVTAQVGYGPGGSDPTAVSPNDPSWTWFSAAYNVQVGNDDEYMGAITAPGAAGTYAYTYRYSLDGGATWTAADLNGAGANAGLTFEPAQLGVMTVVPEPWGAASLGMSGLACMRLIGRRRRTNASARR